MTGTIANVCGNTEGAPQAKFDLTRVIDPNCASLSLGSTSASVPATASNNNINVSAASNCSWTVSALDNWISRPNPSSGTGNGTILYSVMPNNGAPRTGIIVIADKTFTVN